MRKRLALLNEKIILSFILLLIAGCSGTNTPAPEITPPTDQSTETTIVLEATSTSIPSPSPTQVSIPEGLIDLPVNTTAQETAAALFSAEHPARDYNQLAEQLLGIDPIQLTPELPGESELKVNDRAEFFINANLAGDYQAIPTRLRYLSDHAAWWTSITARVTDEEIQAAAKRFEEEIYKINQLIFGKEWSPGIDNKLRIHILMVEEPRWGGFYGYFSNINELPTALEPFSNQKEMFVINLGAVRVDSAVFGGELAHEYQHLIHWSKDHNEDYWLNEAMGELAVFLSGAPQTSSALAPSNIEFFALNPDIQLTSRPEKRLGDEDNAAFMHYGAEKLFAIYLLEQFGPQFIKDLVNNPDPGVISIQQELDKLPNAPHFDDVFANWLLANLLNQPDLAQGQYGYKEFQPVLPTREEINSFRGEPIAVRLLPYGARYYEIQAQGSVQVSFKGSSMARLTAKDPANGQYTWYSNRGDDSNFSLSRIFDLSEAETATLNYKVWHELEDYYDYAYLEVSVDGGQHWQILDTQHGTDLDPNRRSYGKGYTGTSLDWLQETIDLSPYAGQVIQLRFEVISDFTTNRDGLQLDDIEIPEINFFDGAEDNSGGWEAHGFIRSSNLVPVNWIVWLIELTDPTRVTRIELTDGRTANFKIDGFGDQFPFAALVVSPAAPTTTMDVNYELVFQSP